MKQNAILDLLIWMLIGTVGVALIVGGVAEATAVMEGIMTNP